MAKRERFFEFRWPYVPMLVFALASAWLGQGPLFVLAVCAVTAVIIGVYYLVWRWLRERRA